MLKKKRLSSEMQKNGLSKPVDRTHISTPIATKKWKKRKRKNIAVKLISVSSSVAIAACVCTCMDGCACIPLCIILQDGFFFSLGKIYMPADEVLFGGKVESLLH